jgi:spore maturation protein SpmA
MLNYIWLGLILCAVVLGGANGHLPEVTKAAFDMAETAVMKVALPLIGVMALWLGIMRLAEKSGMVQVLARMLRPIMKWLFPDVPAEHPAMGSMIMNVAANMLGLSNAATPLGIRAIKDLESLNPRPGTATNAMCTFLVINTASVQLIPATAVAVLATNGSKDPASIIIPALIATAIAAVAAVAVVKFMEKLPMFRLPPVTEQDKAKKLEEVREEAKEDEPVAIAPMEWWGKVALFLYFAFFAALFFGWLGASDYFLEKFKFLPFDSQDKTFVRIIKCFSVISVPLMLSFFPLYAALRRIRVYNEFVEGAKEGYKTIVAIIPNLVAILVAIAMFRGAGGIDILTDWLRKPMAFVHFPPELLPMALIRPLTGSGSMGVFVEMVQHYGPDNILSRMAGTIYGSTETTFYVLAVYFGVVNIKRARHAVPAGLVADTVAIIASVAVCKMMFG